MFDQRVRCIRRVRRHIFQFNFAVAVGKVVAWHQDAGLRPDGGPNYSPESERANAFGLDAMVNAWMPLVHATRRNGAMKFVPRTHKLGYVELTYCRRGVKKTVSHQIDCSSRNRSPCADVFRMLLLASTAIAR